MALFLPDASTDLTDRGGSSPGRKQPSRFDNEPPAPLQLAGELFGGDPAQQLPGIGLSHSQFGRRPRGLVRRRLQSSDELVCLGPRELAGGLALREPHRSAGIPEALVTRCVQKFQQLVHLT